MKTWQKVLVVLMCIVMAMMCIWAITTELVNKRLEKVFGDKLSDVLIPNATVSTTQVPETTKPDDSHENERPEHFQSVKITFEAGKMKVVIEENCSCGEVTSFGQTCASKEAALNSIKNIKCADGIFVIVENEEEKPITRAELIERVEKYSFEG